MYNALSNFCLCYLKHNKTAHDDKTHTKRKEILETKKMAGKY
jgi:hypothetical protein